MEELGLNPDFFFHCPLAHCTVILEHILDSSSMKRQFFYMVLAVLELTL